MPSNPVWLNNPLLNDKELLGAIEEVAAVLAFGKGKHKSAWKRRSMQHHLTKSFRHQEQFIGNTGPDHETGKSPMAHAICRMLFMLALDRRSRGV